MRSLFTLWLVLGVGIGLIGQTPNQFAQQYRVPLQHAQQPVQIDGRLEEPIWQTQAYVQGFQQNFPSDTLPAVGETRVWVAYDQNFLYVAAECLHAVEGSYVVESLQRDFERFQVDFFSVIIDPANDQTNGFYFALSPYGVQSEGLISLTSDVALNWDNKWYGEAVRHGDRWTLEMAIPYKTLRYPEDNPLWRVNFARGERRFNNQVSSWVPVPINQNVDNLLFTGALRWPELPPKPGRNLALIPYALTDALRDYETGTPWQHSLAYGFDAKVAVSPSLNLDLTVNPDFSTVDADVQQINLTRFALFFPERRQFFLENADLFGTFGFGNVRPFFSRRIGLGIPIVAGARLSGKLGTQWRIGLMNIQTEGSARLEEGETEEDILLPQNYTVAAIQRQVLKTSNISAIFVNRQAYNDAAGRFPSQDFNRVTGLDFNYQHPNSKWSGEAFYHRSFSPDHATNPHALGWRAEYNDRNWEIRTMGEHINQHYDPQVGFVPLQRQSDADGNEVRLTYTRNTFRLGYTFQDQGEIIQRHGPNFFGLLQMDSTGRPTDVETNFWYLFQFPGFANLVINYSGSFTRLLYPFGLSNDETAEPLPVGSYRYASYSIEYNSDTRKRLRYEAEAFAGKFYTGSAQGLFLGLSYRVQPWGNFALNTEYNRLQLPENNGGEERFLLVGTEVNISFTRSLFFKTFLQYNSQAENTNINTRLQWRFRPQSDVFFVYIDNYDQLFNIRNRALVLKVVYWLSS